MLLLLAGAATALALGAPAGLVAAGLLSASLGIALLSGGRIISRALEVAGARAEQRLQMARDRRALGFANSHGWLRKTEEKLEDLAASDLDPALVAAAARSAEMLARLHDSLESTKASRGRYRGGRVPAVGGGAGPISERLGGALKPYSWTPSHLLPPRLRGATVQTSMVIDEIRVLHNAEIERSVLLLTLAARTILILLAPLLGAWVSADTPLADTGLAADLVWGLAAAISLATLFYGPRIVELAMTDSEDGYQLRRLLLWIEVPVALAALVLLPAWTVVVFVTGWTNWWQRQTPGLAFDWRKLAIFVAAVVGLQATGLALQSVGAIPAAIEIVAALAVIAVTGGSYGAMLPLTVATAIGVVVGDGARSIRIARATRSELLSCSRQLAITAATIDATAPEVPRARAAATLARQGARSLEREADLFSRRGVLARRLLVDLCDQAISLSTLSRADSQSRRIALAAAREAGLPDPPFAVAPILGAGLALAQVNSGRHAQVLLRFLTAALNEASTHGTGGVRLLARREREAFLVTVGNLPRRSAVGDSGEGGASLAYLASELPGGRLTEPFGLRPSPAVGLPPSSSQWWVVELECEIAVLAIPLE